MDPGPASPPSPTVDGPSPLWRLAERRSRKTGIGNIFSGVNLWQLQRLFRAAGDQDAEQRAQLVWDHRDEAELAQALIGLRTRSQRRGLRNKRRDALESHWLRAFNHLRIGEASASSSGTDPGETDPVSGAEDAPQRSPNVEATESTGSTASQSEVRGPAAGTPDSHVRVGSGLKRGGDSDPDRYLHRILH